jgi:hypothetical protein
MQTATASIEEIRARMGDDATTEDAEVMLRILRAECIDDTDALSDAEWLALSERAVARALWWRSTDGTGELPMGEYATLAEAEAAIPGAWRELFEQCADIEQRANMLDGDIVAVPLA